MSLHAFSNEKMPNRFIACRYIGWSIDGFDESYGSGRAKSKGLPNGNIVNAYGYSLGKCMTVHEFDPEVRIIDDWRFEGLKGHCGMSR